MGGDVGYGGRKGSGGWDLVWVMDEDVGSGWWVG